MVCHLLVKLGPAVVWCPGVVEDDLAHELMVHIVTPLQSRGKGKKKTVFKPMQGNKITNTIRAVLTEPDRLRNAKDRHQKMNLKLYVGHLT
ncbi:hypothetical protein BaRGS_00035137 [Batillaria attramentaria]|uniref:Uncharacterized protein n=1 Tax=Batillaria attramentaria TaxID=370345 RepID=A0ABD0JFK2_9CAEN